MHPGEHKERHAELHKKFDELVADYVLHHPGKLLRETMILDLMEWSHEQVFNPTEERVTGARFLRQLEEQE